MPKPIHAMPCVCSVPWPGSAHTVQTSKLGLLGAGRGPGCVRGFLRVIERHFNLVSVKITVSRQGKYPVCKQAEMALSRRFPCSNKLLDFSHISHQPMPCTGPGKSENVDGGTGNVRKPYYCGSLLSARLTPGGMLIHFIVTRPPEPRSHARSNRPLAFAAPEGALLPQIKGSQVWRG